MSTVVDIVAYCLLALTVVAGLAAVFFTTFGTLIILAGCALFAVMTGLTKLGVGDLIILLVLYLVGEAFEMMMVFFGMKRFGASNRAVWGALAGGMTGGLLGAVAAGVGVLAGSLLGIFAGAFIAEYSRVKSWERSLKAGVGGVAGRVASIIGKLTVAFLMLGMVAARLVVR